MSGRRNTGGFTLVELLVVMALMSLVMLGLAGAMRSAAQVENRVDVRLTKADDFRVAVGFLRATLERVSIRRLEGLQAGQSDLPFAADAESVTWVGVMPARYGIGGRHFFRLGAEAIDSGKRGLVLRHQPFADGRGSPNWSQAEALVLVSDLNRLTIRYQDARLNGLPWRADWPFNDRLPIGISASIVTTDEIWPEIIVPLYVTTGPADSSGVFVTGGERK